jgi:hypothetical protein
MMPTSSKFISTPFYALDDEGWPTLAELLAEDERLRFDTHPLST